MAGVGFFVDPAALHRLAGEFERAADELSRQAAGFSTATRPDIGLFGLLPQAQSAYQRYLRLAQAGLDGLLTAGRTMEGDLGANLHIQATNYLESDQTSTPR